MPGRTTVRDKRREAESPDPPSLCQRCHKVLHVQLSGKRLAIDLVCFLGLGTEPLKRESLFEKKEAQLTLSARETASLKVLTSAQHSSV